MSKYTYRIDRKDKAPMANNVFVVLQGSENDCNPGNLMIYSPIGQHGEGSKDYIRYNTKKITRSQYLKASKGIYTPQEYIIQDEGVK